jgi:hypothetical protein
MENSWQSALAGWTTAAGVYRTLPGLRGFWPMTAIDGSGNFTDQSGNGLTLTNNNTAQVYYDDLAGYTRFTSADSESATRTDEAAFDITGLETYINGLIQGLTIGAWVQPVTLPGTIMNLMSKWKTATADRSYRLTVNASSQFQLGVSDDGTTTYSIPATTAAVVDTWYFVVGRYSQDTPKIDLFVNDTQYTDDTSIAASLHSGAGDFAIGTNHAGTELFNGRLSLAFLCAAALPDVFIESLYRKTRYLFA